ncbi:MAG: hypothetical protein ABIG61_03765 [Planctomycetota bacterium]
MAEQNGQKLQSVPAKSFLAVGPTLHYSHANVFRCWLLSLAVFVLACMFWSKFLSGSFFSFDLFFFTRPRFWRLGRHVLSPLSIFEYPWHILVLGLLMGIISVVPILVSQLLSFRYSLLFILSVFFIANLPAYAMVTLICCIGAACRPLRFRSRFVAIALCTSPLVLYLCLFGSGCDLKPIRWGFCFAPWLCSWLTSLAIAGLILGIGHFTRYRPGLVWSVTLIVLIIALAVFKSEISFAELSYQQYIAKNNPEEIAEFHSHSITEALDRTITDPAVRQYLAGFFYPEEPILLRKALKREIRNQLGFDHWPSWFLTPPELQYQQKRDQLLQQYDRFIDPSKPWWLPGFLYNRFINSNARRHRMPIALYYKALLGEIRPDLSQLEQKEILSFYNDYPHHESIPTWYYLYREFGDSLESIEARLRIAVRWAAQEKFQRADTLAEEAYNMTVTNLNSLNAETENPGSVPSLFAVFYPPQDSTITEFKLKDLQRKLRKLRKLISSENLGNDQNIRARLARFIMLNPYSEYYPQKLDTLLGEVTQKDPLFDNIILAKTMLITDPQRRAEELKKLAEDLKHTDGGIQALYELAMLKVRLWQSQAQIDSQTKPAYLAEARAVLQDILTIYPQCIFAEQAETILNNLPATK